MAFLDDVTDWVTSQVAFVSLHIGDPGAGGANEYAGGAYARQVPSFDPSSSGSADLTANLEFDGLDNDGPITHIGLWRTGPVFWIGLPAATPLSFNSDGRLDVASIDVTEAFA